MNTTNITKTMKRTYPIIIAFVLLSAVLFAGCASSPYGWETRFFNLETNWVTNVVVKTETAFQTNIVDREVFSTNWVNGIPAITVQPVRETTVTSVPVVTYQTNVEAQITYTANTNATGLAETAGMVVNTFFPGVGGTVTSGLLGLLALYGGLRSRKLKKTSNVLAQGIEIYGEIVKTIGGEAGLRLDRQVKSELSKQQDEAGGGVKGTVVDIVRKIVDNGEAQKSAATIRKLAGP